MNFVGAFLINKAQLTTLNPIWMISYRRRQTTTVGSNLWILEAMNELATANAIADNIQNPEI